MLVLLLTLIGTAEILNSTWVTRDQKLKSGKFSGYPPVVVCDMYYQGHLTWLSKRLSIGGHC
jgi:hypothetical protein